jgi:hypothetical protein
MTAAASAARVSQALVGDPSTTAEVAVSLSVVVTGGLIEGIALGSAQAWAFRATHPALQRTFFVVATVLVAGLGWAAASAPATLSPPASGGSEPSQALVVLGGAGLGLVMGPLLGSAQALALRGAVIRPGRWVIANTLAWVPAMALIFLGATSAQGDWSGLQVALLGMVTGVAAGAALGAVLGRWVPRLGVRPRG